MADNKPKQAYHFHLKGGTFQTVEHESDAAAAKAGASDPKVTHVVACKKSRVVHRKEQTDASK